MLNDEDRRALDAASEGILGPLSRFGNLHPVILLDLVENRVSALPVAEFREELSERPRVLLDASLEKAEASGGIVVFLRDSSRRTLRSVVLDAPTDLGGG